jgi:periplasmic divalent cation tolerance protein
MTKEIRSSKTVATGKHVLVLVTAPAMKTARKLAQAALKGRLIACANLIRGIESHYRWQGRLETGAEVLMVLKTTAPRLSALQKLIVAKHPYETPEFIVLAVSGGNKRYLDWLEKSVP